MKIAIMGDIHGNSTALERVLREVKKEGIKHIIVTGDFLGYYYDHDKVFDLLNQFEWQGVQGNHDAALYYFITRKKNSMKKYRSLYGSSLDIALEVLKKDQIKMILSLPLTINLAIEGRKIMICHGSPWSQNEYIYPDSPEKIFNRIAILGYDFVILGHTHYPFIIKKGKSTIVNPGSVGQSRNEGSSASWAIADFKKREVRLRRTPFSLDKILKQIEKNNPEIPYLKDVLMRKT